MTNVMDICSNYLLSRPLIVYNVDMAKKKINEPIETTDTTPNTKVLKNGAVYDMDKKRIVSAPTIPPINAQNAREFQKMAIAKKREVAAAAANLEVQDVRALTFGDYAYVADTAINMQRLATSPEAGKAAVMAASWLMDHTGLSEKAAQPDQAPTVGDVAELVNALASFISTARDVIPMRSDIVDVEAE